MKLSLLDRYKIVKHTVKAALNPKTKMVIIFRLEQTDPELKISGVYPGGFKYTDPIFDYFSKIGAHADSLEELNKRVSGFNSMTVDAYVKLKGLVRSDFGVLAKPVRYLPDEVPIEKQPTVSINVKTE